MAEPHDGNVNANLHLKPGELNPEFADNDTTVQDVVNISEIGPWGFQAFCNNAALTTNKWDNAGRIKAVLLKVINPHGPDARCPPAANGATTSQDKNAPQLNWYVVRIPEKHFPMGKKFIPKSLEDPDKNDLKAIMVHSENGGLVQAATREAQDKPVGLGQQVWIEIGKSAFPKYLGPVDSKAATTKVPKKVGPASPPPDYGKLLEECAKIYPNAGATGDLIGSDKNLWKSNSGRPIANEIGIPDGPVLPGPIHKEWVVQLFRDLKKEGKYKGLIWTGVCENNGPQDNLNMLSTDGKKVLNGDPGRSTVIYMPAGTDPTAPLEIIYWFHDAIGFRNEMREWNSLWFSLKDMIKKKKSLSNSQRNFVFVIPEMLWSQQATLRGTGIPRNKTKAITFSPDETSIEIRTRRASYTDRQWAAWGFNGVNAPRPNEWDPKKKDLNTRIAASFQGLPNGPLPIEVAGDMKLLHEEVVTILKNHFNVPFTGNITHITLMAEGKGGVAISNLARTGKLGPHDGQLNPSRIVLIQADHGSMGVFKTPAGIKEYNYFHDNDAYEIMKNIDKNTQLELHVSWASDAAKLPTQAAGAFVGMLSDTTKLLNESSGQKTFEKCREKLEDLYTWAYPTYPLLLYQGAEPPDTEDPDPTGRQYFKRARYLAGHSFLKGKSHSMIRMAPPFENVIYKGWGINSARGAIAWWPAEQNIPTPMAVQQQKVSLLDAEANIPQNIQRVFKKFGGRTILYKSELVGESKTVAILEPPGATAYNSYELIYYLHGDIGINGAAKTYEEALANQFKLMAGDNRNVVIVLMDIDANPSSASATLWADVTNPEVTFNSFHEEVLNKIKDKWSLGKQISEDGTVSYDVPVVDPAFFTIKAHGGGSRMLKHAIQKMNPKYMGAPGGLQRIDFYDANWGPDLAIVDTLNNNEQWKKKVKLGETFEIQIVATSKPIGSKKIPAKNLAAKYSAGDAGATEGVWVLNSTLDYGSLPYKYFSAATKIPGGIPQIPVPGENPNNASEASPPGTNTTSPIPLMFDEKGHAYAPSGPPHYGKRMQKYDLNIDAFYKGRLENHTPSTEEVGKIESCLVDSRKTHHNTKTPTLKAFSEKNQDCNTNPLGLIQYDTSQFTNIIIEPTHKGFSWATTHAGAYLRGLDDGMWGRMEIPAKWYIKDLSPENANGVDTVSKRHSSHREGIDLDINLPKIDTSGEAPLPIGQHKKVEVLKTQELDLDKTLAFMILSKLHGAAAIFLDKKFFKPLRERANFIASDGFSTNTPGSFLVIDKALRPFFREHLFRRPDYAKAIMQLLEHKPRHEDHFQVRVTRKWGSHETRDYPGWAIKRLRSLGCNYKG